MAADQWRAPQQQSLGGRAAGDLRNSHLLAAPKPSAKSTVPPNAPSGHLQLAGIHMANSQVAQRHVAQLRGGREGRAGKRAAPEAFFGQKGSAFPKNDATVRHFAGYNRPAGGDDGQVEARTYAAQKKSTMAFGAAWTKARSEGWALAPMEPRRGQSGRGEQYRPVTPGVTTMPSHNRTAITASDQPFRRAVARPGGGFISEAAAAPATHPYAQTLNDDDGTFQFHVRDETVPAV